MQGLTPRTGLPREAAAALFDAWVVRLTSEQLHFNQHGAEPIEGGQRFTYSGPGGARFVVVMSGTTVKLETTEHVAVADVDRIVSDALAKVSAGDLGSTVVYVTELTVQPLDLFDPLQFVRMITNQVHIEGVRALGRAVILDFPAGLSEGAFTGGLFLAPLSKVKVTIFVDGPIESTFTTRLARAMTEITAALCAVATGRAATFDLPQWGEEDDETRVALTRRDDPSIHDLAWNGMTLDILDYLPLVAGPEAALRARSSALAYHAALAQRVPDIAVMLLVTSMEALIAPSAPWGKDKVTKRFISSVAELCPDAVDEIIEHADTKDAFDFVRRGGVTRQRRDLLDKLYQLRSRPTHAGPGLSPLVMAEWTSAPTERVALLSDLARAALLAFIQAPRSSLIGHPVIDPPAPG